MDCLFCNIINNKIEKKLLYSDDYVEIIMDAYPNTDGHCLIITKKHYNDILDIDDDVLKHISVLTKKISLSISENINVDGITIYNNYGFHQQIKHYHQHIMPVYSEQVGIKFLQKANSNEINNNYLLIKKSINDFVKKEKIEKNINN